jgi:hypothetical protein
VTGRSKTRAGCRIVNETLIHDLAGGKFIAQAPTGEMAVTPPSIRKSAPTTYAESSDAR